MDEEKEDKPDLAPALALGESKKTTAKVVEEAAVISAVRESARISKAKDGGLKKGLLLFWTQIPSLSNEGKA